MPVRTDSVAPFSLNSPRSRLTNNVKRKPSAKESSFSSGTPGTEEIFSGYGLATQAGSAEILVDLLMVDRSYPADLQWLAEVEATFGECQLVAMTPAGGRGRIARR